ncbi:MAG: hypothetical protein D6675_05890 [Gemmatimonadetes bacterium]|nr:MAG: hypothetical protein D6675_05890 [Gemmatimonadota bacterium]
MTKSLRYVSLTLCLLFLPSVVFGSGIARSGLGSKSNAMGGAFRAISDDYTAAFWNPAGLGQLETSTVGLIADFITPNLYYTPKTGRLGYSDGLEIRNKAETIFVPAMGGFYSMQRGETRYVFGLGIYVPFGSSTEWNTYTPPPGYSSSPEITEFPEFNRKSSLRTIDVHPALGIRFNDKISVGLGMSFQYGAVEFIRTAFQPSGFPYAPYDLIPIDTKMEADGWGIGFNTGILFTPNDKLRFAITARTGIKMEMEGTATLTAYMPTTTEPLFLAAAPTLFIGGTLASKPDAKADLTTPAELGFGLAYQLTDKMLVSFDVSQTYWRSAIDVVDIEIDGDSPFIDAATGQPIPATDSKLYGRFDDTIRLSFGLEYELMPTLMLRGGYYFDETAVPNQSYVPTWTDVGDRNVFSVGFAYDLGKFTVEADYQYTALEDRTVATQSFDDEGAPLNLPGEYTGSAGTVHTSFIYNF